MEMPKPSDGHRLFEKMAGSWIGDETIYPGPMDPVGGKAISRYSTRIGVNGFALISDYEQERGGAVTFRGHAVFTFEPQSGDYVMYWVDTMGMPGETFRGRFDGNTLTLSSQNPMGQARLSYSFSADDRIMSRMEVSQDGFNWMPFFDSTYAKAPPPPSPARPSAPAPAKRKPPVAKKKPAPVKKKPAPPPKKVVAKKKPIKKAKGRR
jgi:hypothetical protein